MIAAERLFAQRIPKVKDIDIKKGLTALSSNIQKKIDGVVEYPGSIKGAYWVPMEWLEHKITKFFLDIESKKK